MSKERQQRSKYETSKEPPRKLCGSTWLQKCSAQRRNRKPVENWHTGFAQEQTRIEHDLERPRQEQEQWCEDSDEKVAHLAPDCGRNDGKNESHHPQHWCEGHQHRKHDCGEPWRPVRGGAKGGACSAHAGTSGKKADSRRQKHSGSECANAAGAERRCDSG
jgi:hypothetical protein